MNVLAHIWFALSTDTLQMFAARILAGLAAAIGTGFVAGPALGGLFSGLGEGPLHKAPFILAAAFGTIALLLSLRLNERVTKAPASIAAKTLLLDRIKIVFCSELAL